MSFPKAAKTVATVSLATVSVAAAVFFIGPRPGQPTPTASAAVAAGGATTIEVLDPVHGRPFDVATWAAVGDETNTLVVISHGFSGDGTSHDDIASRLAADGFTVAAPTHPDLAGLESNDPQLDPLVLRPRHVSLTIDHLASAASEPFDAVIVVGHSLGGYGALGVAGANPSGADVAGHCEANPSDDVLCTPAARGRIGRLIADAADFTDPTVDAIVLLAPAYGPLFSASDTGHVGASALIMTASIDDQLPGGQVEALLQAMPAGTDSVTVDGGHFVFIRTCTPTEQSTLPELCTDEPSVDREHVHTQVVSEIEHLANR